ncbi:hypothetical protein HDV02_004883 [Globomyces sp. JEL0801]|nr:hypothetical protein HDV02_004883 [Globomyces sp. JEL0801]
MASLKRSFEPTNTNSKKLKESEDDPNDDLVNFQKKAIWVQMNEYKRLHENVNSDFENLKAENQRILNTVNQFCRYWTMIETELNLPHSKLSTELLSSSKDNLKALDVSWEKVKANISAKGTDMPTNIHENQLELTGSISILQGQLEIEKSKSEELEVKLEKSKAELLYTQKKLDRVKLLKEPPPIVVKKTESEQVMKCDYSTQTNKQETQQTLPTEEFKDAINLAEKRLADIEALNREKLQLNLDLQKTQTELAELKGIVNSNRELENQLKLQLSEDTAKTEIEKLLRENELLVSQRRSYVEQIRNDEEKRRKALDNDLKKCEADLNRLRSARDLLQRTVEVQNAKEISDFKQLEEIKTVSESRKERIQSLESELTRLKMLIASNTGEHALMAFFDEKSDQNPYKTIAGQFEKNKQRITDLQNIIMKLENSSQGQVRRLSTLTEQVMETILAEKERARIAEEKLDKYTQLFGPITSNDPESLCKEQLRKKEEELSNLKGKIEYHLKAEQRLVVELETLGKAWSKLEDQNTKKLANLAEREEQLARIGTEKVKLEQKIGLLTKQNTSYHNMGIAQKRQSEKQLEQIRKLDELERSLSQQLV